jgi:predicted naringenin-chalcone synthase
MTRAEGFPSRAKGNRVTHINRIATAVPHHDVHSVFLDFAAAQFGCAAKQSALFRRMARHSGIEHRYSCLSPDTLTLDRNDTGEGKFYRLGSFPDTAARMQAFDRYAPELAATAVERLALGPERQRISHLIVTTCTGLSAPGVDLELIDRCRLPRGAERTMIGFMGCYAAINGLKLARHIVRSEPEAQVLLVNIELCTLHLQETTDIEKLLSFMLFADGCAASLVTAKPEGLAIDSFRAVVVPQTSDLITWHIRNSGFDMILSGQVPAAIQDGLRDAGGDILRGVKPDSIDLWAVHPGGRTVLDAVERAFDLDADALSVSREVLRRHGNMSSATVMFVLERMLRNAAAGDTGCAMSFGPGMVAETMLFHAVGAPSAPRLEADALDAVEA